LKGLAAIALALPVAPLLLWQARRVRRLALRLPEAGGERAGVCDLASTGAASDAPPLRLLILGDSSAAGVGIARQRDAFAGQLVAQLAQRLQRPVRWRLAARTGLATRDAIALLDDLQPERFDVAVVVLGVNDVTAPRMPAGWVKDAGRLVRRLRERHRVRRVLWSGLPPMHRFPLLPEPLRSVVGLHARSLDTALARWCERQRRPTVLHVPMPPMGEDRSVMADDGYHPGPAAVGTWVAAVSQALVASYGQRALPPSGSPSPARFTPAAGRME
jgi:lysophospholipase L1-like esterase